MEKMPLEIAATCAGLQALPDFNHLPTALHHSYTLFRIQPKHHSHCDFLGIPSCAGHVTYSSSKT